MASPLRLQLLITIVECGVLLGWAGAGVGIRRGTGRRRATTAPAGNAVARAVDRRHRVLADLEAVTRRQDPRFAHGLRDGRPVPPWEYRQRGERLALTGLAAVQVLMLIVGWYPVVVAVGVVVLALVARRS
jgi:Protein of unknown function (DUF3040)